MKIPLAKGQAARTGSAQVLLRGAVDEKTGEAVSSRVLAVRVGWCAGLVAGMTAGLLAERWNQADVAVLGAGIDAQGRTLPSNAWMALRRLGWPTSPPEGLRVNDRIVRMAQEQAGRTLRSAVHRAGLVEGVLKTWPTNPGKRTPAEWDAVRAAVPDGKNLPANVIGGRTRQIARFARKHGRLPADAFELEGLPHTPRMLILAACDRQQATLQRCENDPARALLRVLLPVRPDPRSYADWHWVACPLVLPPIVPAGAVLHLPTLRPVSAPNTAPNTGTVRTDLAFTHAVPAASRTGHTVAIGVDWGVNTLLSAGAVHRHQDGRITTLGAGAQFRAAGVAAKLHRLRRQGEHLHAKTDHHQLLIDGAQHTGQHDDAEHPLTARHALLTAEARHVADRRTNLNDALARQAARWAVDQAIAAGATVIYLEDLRSMEGRNADRRRRTRLSQQVRGQIVAWMRHLAAEAGIAVVTVPARDTSKRCPHCLVPLRHRAAPDRPTVPGWKWAICPNPACRWQGDRDCGAWRRIAARGLTHQDKTTTLDRTTGELAIRAVVDKLEAQAVIAPATTQTFPGHRDRSKTGPTRRRKTPRSVPRRRGAPSTPQSIAQRTGSAGQRPEGHAPTGQRPHTPQHAHRALPRAARRNQGVNTIGKQPTTNRRHRPRGAALGAGFHLHAHATPPWWENIHSETPLRLRIA
ncbi:zinc ribbon domain-containing protein [Actinomadura sp. 6N118]|uniref:zinc ribbon domain-containing protein n=1 Tax=Actinomadura sp. 6N118 TaxID=3375151 RepID=UPI00378F680D